MAFDRPPSSPKSNQDELADLSSVWDASDESAAPLPSASRSGTVYVTSGDRVSTDTPFDTTPTSPGDETQASGVVDALAHAARMHGVLVRGSKFGVYVVGRCIGEGGMARVYQAEHEGLRRQVALKVLSNGFAQDPEGRERFVREARMAAAIKHPNVVNIFDVGLQQDIPYLVMELLEGTDLEALLQNEGGPLAESTIVDIMVPVVAGLIAVHDAGIVHRDLKPGNIFLAKGRYAEVEPKLLDFGVSRVSGLEQLRLTSNGLLGTPFYMAPEGLRGEEMTPLSDQYSLGVLMYECATARAPFTASSLPELIRVITEGKYHSPQAYNPSLSKRLARIITRAMSLNPAERFKDLRELGRDLLLLSGQRTRITWGLSFGDAPNLQRSGVSGSVPPIGGTVPPLEDASTSRWRKAAAWALLPAALLALFMATKLPSNAPVYPVAQDEGSASATANADRAASEPAPRADDRVQVTAEEPAPPPSPIAPQKRMAFLGRLPGPIGGARARTPEAPSGTGLSDTSDTPDWALPGSNAPTTASQSNSSQGARGELPSGTNGAPIFD